MDLKLGDSEERQRPNRQKIGYVLYSFPSLSETFVQREILELERQGLTLHIFSLSTPSAKQDAKLIWKGCTQVTYISCQPRLSLLLAVLRAFLTSPLLFLSLCIIAIAGRYRLRTLVGSLVCAAFLAAQMKRENITHLHAHFAAETTTVAQFTHVLTGIPYSFTAHAYDIYLSSQAALASKIKMARFVVTISEYNRKYLVKLVDQNIAERIHCIYNGLNLRDFPVHLLDASLPQKDQVILAVSRLVEKKGLFYLLDACHSLACQGYSFTCYIIGEGPLRQELEQRIRERELSQRVILLGARTQEQVIEMYQKTTIMALPCTISKDGDRDGIPTVLIESLYMGIPSVSTTVSGIPELITSEVNGLLVPPGDSTALADAIARLFNDSSLYARLAINGRKTIMEKFDLSCNIKQLIYLFNGDNLN